MKGKWGGSEMGVQKYGPRGRFTLVRVEFLGTKH